MADDDGFLSRWSRRKAQVQRGEPAAEAVAAPTAVPAAVPAVTAGAAIPAATPVPAQAAPAATADAAAADRPAEALPTLDDVAALTPDSDYSRFVARGVQPDVKNAALKKLFSDPHFNLMDGLDTYIDDYGKPDPLPAGMLEKMAQSAFLGLFTEKTEAPETLEGAAATATPPTPNPTPPDEDPDLQLQRHDAAGRPGPEPGAAEDAARQP